MWRCRHALLLKIEETNDRHVRDKTNHEAVNSKQFSSVGGFFARGGRVLHCLEFHPKAGAEKRSDQPASARAELAETRTQPLEKCHTEIHPAHLGLDCMSRRCLPKVHC